MTDITQQTLAGIVTNNHQAVQVLEKYQLDFCCKGKRTLADACVEKGLTTATIANELALLQESKNFHQMSFNEMNAEQLIGYILIHHHFYVKQIMPQLYGHLEKVANKHGDRFPYMKQVFQLFSEIQEEMTAHMQKEEMILFPRIKEAEKLFTNNKTSDIPPNYINGPMNVMEMEHDHAGDIMFQIRSLTNNYTAPDSACTTFKVSLAELKEFEEDLHRHVHLENNILFPMAKQFVG